MPVAVAAPSSNRPCDILGVSVAACVPDRSPRAAALCTETVSPVASLLFAHRKPTAVRAELDRKAAAWAAGPVAMGAGGMAKSKTKSVVLRLMSQAGTGYYYTFRTTLKGVREKCACPAHAACSVSC